MNSTCTWRKALIGTLCLSLCVILGLALWQADFLQARMANPSIERDVEQLDAMQSSITSMQRQLADLERRLGELRTRLAGSARHRWAPQPDEFLAILRTQRAPSLGFFTATGPRQDSFKPIDEEVHHVTFDPGSGKLFGLGNHRVVEIHPETLALTELKVDAKLPEFSWPCGIAFDSARGRVVVATLGGEGYFYAYDPASKQWSLISSLQNVDLAGLAYSATYDRLIGLEVPHEGAARLLAFNSDGAQVASRNLNDIAPRRAFGQFGCQLATIQDAVAIVAMPGHEHPALGPSAEQTTSVVPLAAWLSPDAPRTPAELVARTGETSQPATKSVKSRPLDLQPFANQSLDEPFHLAHMTDNNLSQLPRGEQVLDGVTFSIGDRCIQLSGTLLTDRPTSSGEMPLTGRVARLHFLHASGWGEGSGGTADLGYIPDGTQIAKYAVRYSDGTEVEIPVVYGRELRGWWEFQTGLPETTAKVAWRGANGTTDSWGVSLRLYHQTWDNPRPDAEVESVSFESVNHTIAAPFCVAISAEE